MQLIKLGLKKYVGLGNMLFALGLLIAIIAGVVPLGMTYSVTVLLVLIGLIFAILHLETADVSKILLSLLGLIILALLYPMGAAAAGAGVGGVGGVMGADIIPGVSIKNILHYLAVLASPAALILVLKTFIDMIT